MQPITLTINGQPANCTPGTSILDAAQSLGIRIPTLCHHPQLKPYGACRICLVEDLKSGRLMAACVTPVAPDLAIETHSETVLRHRRNIVRLMMAEHPESCLVCNKGNRCQLRQIAAQLGVGETDLYPMPNFKNFEQANPFIVRDLSKCILCGKCIRADHELVEVGAIDYNLRGFPSRPATIHEQGLEDSNCTFCGTCVSMCPTGALSVKQTEFIGTPSRERETICGFCGVGCRLTMGIFGKRVVEVNPATTNDSVNGATLCVRGHFAHDFLGAPQRLTGPLIRRKSDGDAEDAPPALQPATWDQAMDHVAQRLLDIKATYGAQSIGFMGASKCSNEENYLFQKMARTLIGTNNIDNGGSLYGRLAMVQLDQRSQGTMRHRPIQEVQEADLICVIGADPTNSLPVVAYHIKRAVKAGARMVLIDPRRTDLKGFAHLWLPINPGRDVDLINALATRLLEQNQHDPGFIDAHTEGFALHRMGLLSVNLQRIQEVTGLQPTQIDRLAELMAGHKVSWVVGGGILQKPNAVHCLDAILNLCLMTGNYGQPGRGIHLLARENNQVGANDMGTTPDFLPARVPLESQEGRQNFGRLWKTQISPDQGLNLFRMIEEAEKGHLKALYVMGENPLRSLPQNARVRKALQNIEFLVVQDILMTETAALADVVLSGAAAAEKDGSFTNFEGRIQTFERVLSPPGSALPDWQILDRIASAMGQETSYGELSHVRSDMVQHVSLYDTGSGQLAQAIENKPCEIPINFGPVVSSNEWTENPDFPFTALMQTPRWHLGSGTRTSVSTRVQSYDPGPQAHFCLQDAQTLDLTEGDRVTLTSPYGAGQFPVILDRALQPGQITLNLGDCPPYVLDLLGWPDPSAQSDNFGLRVCPINAQKSGDTP